MHMKPEALARGPSPHTGNFGTSDMVLFQSRAGLTAPLKVQLPASRDDATVTLSPRDLSAIGSVDVDEFLKAPVRVSGPREVLCVGRVRHVPRLDP